MNTKLFEFANVALESKSALVVKYEDIVMPEVEASMDAVSEAEGVLDVAMRGSVALESACKGMAQAIESGTGCDEANMESHAALVDFVTSSLTDQPGKLHAGIAMEGFRKESSRLESTSLALENVRETGAKILAAVMATIKKIADFVMTLLGKAKNGIMARWNNIAVNAEKLLVVVQKDGFKAKSVKGSAVKGAVTAVKGGSAVGSPMTNVNTLVKDAGSMISSAAAALKGNNKTSLERAVKEFNGYTFAGGKEVVLSIKDDMLVITSKAVEGIKVDDKYDVMSTADGIKVLNALVKTKDGNSLKALEKVAKKEIKANKTAIKKLDGDDAQKESAKKDIAKASARSAMLSSLVRHVTAAANANYVAAYTAVLACSKAVKDEKEEKADKKEDK